MNAEPASPRVLVNEGLLYLVNVAITGPVSLVLLADPEHLGVHLSRITHPEGFHLTELEHERGLGTVSTSVLSAVVNGIREAEQRLTRELDQRDGAWAGTRDAIDEHAQRLLQGQPRTVDTLALDLNITRAQASSALMRLDAQRQDDSTYTLPDQAEGTP